jgi:hypothetical protein
MFGQISRPSLLMAIIFVGSLVVTPTVSVLGHGDEDHGDQKPKTTSNAKGVISHSTRLGDLEVMVKHPAMEPDGSTTGTLFITKFETNEPFPVSAAKIEIESNSGAIFDATVAAGTQPGTYSVTFPAMPEGVYTMRANLSYGGETDTATFSGVDVKPAEPVADGEMFSITNSVVGVVFLLVILLLSGLVYFVWRFAAGQGVNEEALSA